MAKSCKYVIGDVTYTSKEKLLDYLNRDIEAADTSQELKFYKRGSIDENGKRRETSLAECRIPLHGDFKKLLQINHPDGKKIGTIERLNSIINNEGWLSKDNNRDLVTLAGIRIPGQGMNSIDVMKVREFLPESSGPVIMMPHEVVAKVGADFDFDSFPAMNPNIKVINGKAELRDYTHAEATDMYDKMKKAKVAINKLLDSKGINPEEANSTVVDLEPYNKIVLGIFNKGKKKTDNDYINDISELDIDVEKELIENEQIKSFDEYLEDKNGVDAIENRIIGNIKDLAMMSDNYTSLVKPNGTFMLEPYTEKTLKPLVQDTDFNKNIQPENTGFSPTRTMETNYNLGKVTDITSAKNALGIDMVSLRWKSLLNEIGFHLNHSYKVSDKSGARNAFKKILTLYFPHNTHTVDGKKVISLSHIYSENGIDRISDIKSQKSNADVDAATKAWGAYMQGNREAAPVMNLLIDAGVDKEVILNFVSNPLIREYLQQQREVKGSYSRSLGKPPIDQHGNIQPNFYKGRALKEIMVGPKYGFDMPSDFVPAFASSKKDMDKMLKNYMSGTKEKVNIYAGTGENAELSNFAKRPFKIGSDTFNTVEGAYQASKIEYTDSFMRTGKMSSENTKIFDRLKTATGSEAKTLGRQLKDLDVNSWDKVSSNRMLRLLRESFKQNPDALTKLADTSTAELTHTQDKGKWGTEFPRLLMQVRDELLPEIKKELVVFTPENLLNAVKEGAGKTIGVDYKPSDLDKAALLHFIEIEEMGKAMKDITMRLSGDSKRSKTLFAAHNRQQLIKDLSNNGMIPTGMIEKLLTDTPIASFDTNKFVKESLSPLFTLRDHPALLDFLNNKLKTQVFGDIETTTGDPEEFAAAFINDFVGGYMYQNVLKGFNIDKTTSYKGFNTKAESTVSPVKSLKFGAFVKDKVLYIDRAQLKRNFSSQEYSKDSYGVIDGKKLLASTPADTFKTADEYYHFVFEREYLRSLYDKKAKEMSGTSEKFEEFLRDEALDNIFNTWKVFRSDKNYASEFLKIKQDYPELVKDFSVLKALVVDAEKDREGNFKKKGFKNIKLSTTNLVKDDIDSYHEQLLSLANPNHIKANTPEKNEYITRFFKRMPFMALLQSGMNTDNQYSYIKIVPQDDISRMMEHESKKYIELLNKIHNKEISDDRVNAYYNKFVENNQGNNYSKYRFKDYTLSQDDIKKNKHPDNISGRDISDEKQFKERFGSTQSKAAIQYDTVSENVLQRNLNLDFTRSKQIAYSDPKKTFVYNGAIDNKSTIAGDRLAKDSRLKDYPNTYGITTRKDYRTSIGDKAHLSDDTLEENKKLIEKDIDNLKALKDSGQTLVFNTEGYGQALMGAEDITGNNMKIEKALAPQTFRYLSERLFEEFGYTNKNFLDLPSGRKFMQKAQPVSDEDVRNKILNCFS